MLYKIRLLEKFDKICFEIHGELIYLKVKVA
jgi:hypothetical protein